ncbi:N5-glutamine methyltransferase family protein [Metaclostridioides mangenotii]|uniref:N5-glutamine methyltransferase family protein n=1 Tax=Metaclostridioides mangenotii TaxID=1540 RepID=UPI000463367F|nr:HemK/PrmC family methyltransferase [Clostridioides mangenotii]
MIISDLIKIYSDKLVDISDTPRLDVDMMLCKALGNVDRIYIHMNIDRELDKDKQEYFEKMFEDRLKGRPIAYILNNREFMGLDFYVEEGVLIPRPDTEILVEEIIYVYNKQGSATVLLEDSNEESSDASRELEKERLSRNLKKDLKEELKIVEIGTGSGAITVSLAKYLKSSTVLSLDISDTALKIGEKNAVNNGVIDRVSFKKSNMFSAIEKEDIKFDIVVSNPPYIRRADMDTLQKQVKDFEPHLALDGGLDGLNFYRSITRESKKYLKHGGMLAYEVGHDQAEEVSNILKDEGFKKIYTKKDLQSIDRVVIGFNL